VVFLFLQLINKNFKTTTMGRGDKKTKKGKRFAGSFGKFRMRISRILKKTEAVATK
jgi:ribosomal small subunit protein bTHX